MPSGPTASTKKYPVIVVILAVGRQIAKLTANYTVDFRPELVAQADPARTTAMRHHDAGWTKALALREEGATFAQIAVAHGISPGGAHKRVAADYTAWLAAPVTLLRDQIADRYNELVWVEWDAATADVPNLRAVRAILRATSHRARVLDLYPRDRKDRRNRIGRQIPGDTTDYTAIAVEETAMLTGEDHLLADVAE